MIRKSDCINVIIYLLRNQNCYDCIARSNCKYAGRKIILKSNCAKEYVKFIKEA